MHVTDVRHYYFLVYGAYRRDSYELLTFTNWHNQPVTNVFRNFQPFFFFLISFSLWNSTKFMHCRILINQLFFERIVKKCGKWQISCVLMYCYSAMRNYFRDHYQCGLNTVSCKMFAQLFARTENQKVRISNAVWYSDGIN